jgi:pyruvate dehydrogenase E1 component alpha subunit
MAPNAIETNAPGEPAGAPNATQARELYAAMVLIRVFEEETDRQYKRDRIGGYCHLCSGQEGATVGACAALEGEDLLLTSYRSHGFALARGVSPGAMMAELFGRIDGCARGRGGSMHPADPSLGYLGGWGIVGGQLPLAVGAAFTLAQEGREQAVLCELGEGAVNIGAWHEALNLAAIWDLPVVFLVMNNEYSMGSPVAAVSAQPEVYKRASAFRMEGERVDGQDVEAVREATGKLLAEARGRRRPSVLEAMTYRYRGHSVADPGTSYRSSDELERWRQRDPIMLFGSKLRDRGVFSPDEDLDNVRREAERRVAEAVEFAERSEQPSVGTLAQHVYGDPATAEQFAPMLPGSPFGEAELVLEGGLGHA